MSAFGPDCLNDCLKQHHHQALSFSLKRPAGWRPLSYTSDYSALLNSWNYNKLSYAIIFVLLSYFIFRIEYANISSYFCFSKAFVIDLWRLSQKFPRCQLMAYKGKLPRCQQMAYKGAYHTVCRVLEVHLILVQYLHIKLQLFLNSWSGDCSCQVLCLVY